jgi:hypothetical protein
MYSSWSSVPFPSASVVVHQSSRARWTSGSSRTACRLASISGVSNARSPSRQSSIDFLRPRVGLRRLRNEPAASIDGLRGLLEVCETSTDGLLEPLRGKLAEWNGSSTCILLSRSSRPSVCSDALRDLERESKLDEEPPCCAAAAKSTDGLRDAARRPKDADPGDCDPSLRHMLSSLSSSPSPAMELEAMPYLHGSWCPPSPPHSPA